MIELMNSHVVVVDKGGVGKSLVTEFLAETLYAAGTPADLVELESVAARMKRLEDAGRVKSHRFLKMGESDAQALLADPLALTEYWDRPASFAISNRPTIVDVGAQGFQTLEMWLSINGELSDWAQEDGQHGRGLTFWVPSDNSKAGEDSALVAATSLRTYLPGARIIVVCNRGAPAAVGQRIASVVEQVETMVLPAAPQAVDEIYQTLYSRYGLFGAASLYLDKAKMAAMCAELGVTQSRMIVASRGIAQWAQSVLATLKPLVLPAVAHAAEAAE